MLDVVDALIKVSCKLKTFTLVCVGKHVKNWIIIAMQYQFVENNFFLKGKSATNLRKISFPWVLK